MRRHNKEEDRISFVFISSLAICHFLDDKKKKRKMMIIVNN